MSNCSTLLSCLAFILANVSLENDEFTQMVDAIRAHSTGGPLCRLFSHVAVGDVLGLQPHDPAEVNFLHITSHYIRSLKK